jgi:hypothetical protein
MSTHPLEARRFFERAWEEELEELKRLVDREAVA